MEQGNHKMGEAVKIMLNTALQLNLDAEVSNVTATLTYPDDGLQTCEGKDLEVIIFNLKQISNETQIFN